jgi:predicted alpha/beta-hydrolase family hydrolase
MISRDGSVGDMDPGYLTTYKSAPLQVVWVTDVRHELQPREGTSSDLVDKQPNIPSLETKAN